MTDRKSALLLGNYRPSVALSRRLAELGFRVVLTRDTGALAAAHASVAPSSALDAARNAADIVVLGQDFSQLPVLRRVAIGARRLSIQNFAIVVEESDHLLVVCDVSL